MGGRACGPSSTRSMASKPHSVSRAASRPQPAQVGVRAQQPPVERVQRGPAHGREFDQQGRAAGGQHARRLPREGAHGVVVERAQHVQGGDGVEGGVAEEQAFGPGDEVGGDGAARRRVQPHGRVRARARGQQVGEGPAAEADVEPASGAVEREQLDHAVGGGGRGRRGRPANRARGQAGRLPVGGARGWPRGGGGSQLVG